MSDAIDAAEMILARCRELGFARAGIAPALPSGYGDELRAWIDGGRHGEMAYMARNTNLRLDPCAMIPGAKSIICVADRYWAEQSERRTVEKPKSEAPGLETPGLRSEATQPGVDRHASPDPRPDLLSEKEEQSRARAVGRIARYARGDDYHTVIKKRLHALCDELRGMFPDETFRACVDTAPVLEREHAARAGLGAIGKHTLLIERSVGSYLLLGEIITTLTLTSSKPSEPDPCGTCTRCIDACPTRAITPWAVDATKCISYLTIEHRSEIDAQFHEAMGDWIFGCDICQEVCPHNQPTQRSGSADTHPAYRPRRDGFNLLEILHWSEHDRRDAFGGSALKRAKRTMMKRNALIAAGNALAEMDDPILRKRIETLACDSTEDTVVQGTARTVLARLEK